MITGPMVALELIERGFRVGGDADDLDEFGLPPDVYLDGAQLAVSAWVLDDLEAVDIIRMFRPRLVSYLRSSRRAAGPRSCEDCKRVVLAGARRIQTAKRKAST
jgi:hypothetical protein